MRTLPRLAVIAFLVILAPRVRADCYIVVNSHNPVSTLSRTEVLNLFMGRTRAFPDGQVALIFDLQGDGAKRARFYRALTGMSLAQITSYWSRLMFSGQNLPPQALPDEATMIQVVTHNVNALGWLSSPPTARDMHTVLVLKEKP